MKCDDVFEVILNGSPLTEDMADHIEKCGECRALKEAVQELGAAGAGERRRDISSEAVQSVISAAADITEERNSPPHTKMKEWWLVQRLAAAAAVILAVGFGVMLANRLLSPADQLSEHAAAAKVDLPSGMQGLRDEVKREMHGFDGRYYSHKATSGLDDELADLRGRIAVASVGLENELKGL